MSDWSSNTLAANGIRIHYHRTLGENPPLVLLHGFSDNGLCWTRAARVLQQDYDVIMPDARGHGLSTAPDEGYTSEDYAADVAGLILALDLGRPALLGHSMGAATAATAAAHYPDLVGCLVLEDPPWFGPDSPWARGRLDPTPEQRQAQAEQRRQTITARKSQTRDQIIAEGRAQSPTWHDDEWQPWAESKLQHSANTVSALGAWRTPWTEIVPQIACPTLLVIGDPAHRSIVSPKTAQQAASLNPAITVVQILEAGHSIHREQFEQFTEAATAFLRDPVQGSGYE